MVNSSFLKKIKMISLGSAMADIALLLLIFFMVATTSEPPKGIDVELPTAKTEGADQDSIYITIAKDGRVFYDGNFVTLDNLGILLGQRQSEKNTVVALTADKDLDYSQIQKVMSVLQDRDFLNVVFMAQPNKDNE